MIRNGLIDSSEDCGPLVCLDVVGDVSGMDKLCGAAVTLFPPYDALVVGKTQRRCGPNTRPAPHLRRHNVDWARGEDSRWIITFFLGEGNIGAITGNEVDDVEVNGEIRDASNDVNRVAATACAIFSSFSINLATIAVIFAKMAFMSSKLALISLRVTFMALKFWTTEAMTLALIPSC